MKDNKTARPYPTPTMRRRKTESFFSFEMGPQFTDTKQFYELCSMDQSNNYQVNLYAKMDRGFFRADQDWTCYRRNYFQISSVFQIQSMNYELRGPEVPCLLRKPQELLQVDYFSIGISARVTNNDKKIDLVQHTPKRDKGPQMVPEPRPVRAGGNLHLASVGSNHNIATFERLQFKTATANNGKRRAAQQYYEIVVDLIAHMAHHPPLCVASCVSEPLVVRGRSPGHYSDSHTRFKHMEPTLEAMSSPSQKYTNSLPSSPMSDLGPYSPYHGYPYPSLSTGYSMMNPPMPQYPNNPNQEASYFQQVSKLGVMMLY
ncbi:uncharacterized protein B0P05DRAFT_473597 [Gilbertella persicaria]|uniref:uncharacterized protein n=1 Tax=Gilbertella persicaria TaxID=101096 RepID=UPI00221F61D7|nr:uncharacterized protein B0P05DRAFT_473597 [Gilbertella persicaria]KAI8073427.1 hypothetical protein B0P05DRAFT_473597 [Gilbertella persicaria]